MGSPQRKKRVKFNGMVGLLLVLGAAYFIILFVKRTAKNSVSFYEVVDGSLVKETNYEGLILRTEKVLTSEASGYVNFYLSDTEKASMGQRVYSIDESGSLNSFLSAHADEFSGTESGKTEALRTTLIHSQRDFSPMEFNESGRIRENLAAKVNDFTDLSQISGLYDRLKAEGLQFREFSTDCTGYVSLNIDGYENLSETEVDAVKLNKEGYDTGRVHSGDLIGEGDAVLKLITDENWRIVFPLTAEDLLTFSGKDVLRINFRDKGIETTGTLTVIKGADGGDYGVLSLNKYLVQFLNERFVDFEIETVDVSGLKIPEKAIVRKDFYIIPSEFRAADGRGNNGFYVEKLTEEGITPSFTVCDIYLDDGEYCYVSPTDGILNAGEFISYENGQAARYEVGPVKQLNGVYNINRGYTVFRRIELLEEANGYCIIERNTSCGLSVYDHIILDASGVSEGQVLY